MPQVWDYDGPGYLRWDAADIQQEMMGIVVENSVLQSALVAAARARPGVEFLCPATLESLEQSPSHDSEHANLNAPLSVLRLDEGRSVAARLVGIGS